MKAKTTISTPSRKNSARESLPQIGQRALSIQQASDLSAAGGSLFTRLAGGAVWRLQLAVAFRVAFLLTPRQHVGLSRFLNAS
jgi:hypothetical protein